jgi:Recombination endonuclease VII
MSKHGWRCPKCKCDNPSRLTSVCVGCLRKTKPPRRVPKHRAVIDTMSMADVALLSVLIHGGVPYACGSCGREREPGKLRYRDHDHETAEVRGLLCYQCNRLALAANTLGGLLALLRYLVRAKLFYARRRLQGVSA